jgi:hypothetical protein
LEIKTKALSLVYLDSDHQNLIDRILKLQQDGLNSRQIADYLNDLKITSWTGKRFYSDLVFGVIQKARERARRETLAVAKVSCQLHAIQTRPMALFSALLS